MTKQTKFSLGYTEDSNQQIPNNRLDIDANQLAKHSVVIGATGSGKTQTLKALAIGASRSGAAVLAFDINGDLATLANDTGETEYADTVLWSLNGLGANLSIPVSDLSPNQLCAVLGTDSTAQTRVVSAVLRANPDLVTLDDLKDAISRATIVGISGYFPQAITVDVLSNAIDQTADTIGSFFGPRSFDLKTIVDSGLIHVIDCSPLKTSSGRAAFAGIVCTILESLKSLPISGDLELLVLLDETHRLFKSNNSATSKVLRSLSDVFSDSVRELRKYGVGLCFASQLRSDIPQYIQSNVGLLIQQKLGESDNPKTVATSIAGANSSVAATAAYLASLSVGQAVVRLKGQSYSVSIYRPDCDMAAILNSRAELAAASINWQTRTFGILSPRAVKLPVMPAKL